jgi:hypothetical protein
VITDAAPLVRKLTARHSGRRCEREPRLEGSLISWHRLLIAHFFSTSELKMARLTYFNARGRAEVVRIMCAEANFEYEDYRFRPNMENECRAPEVHSTRPGVQCLCQTHGPGNDEFVQFRAAGRSITGQVPLMEIDGLKIVQTSAICRYLANKLDLAGSTPAEAAYSDVVAATLDDLYIYMVQSMINRKVDANFYVDQWPKVSTRARMATVHRVHRGRAALRVHHRLISADLRPTRAVRAFLDPGRRDAREDGRRILGDGRLLCRRQAHVGGRLRLPHVHEVRAPVATRACGSARRHGRASPSRAVASGDAPHAPAMVLVTPRPAHPTALWHNARATCLAHAGRSRPYRLALLGRVVCRLEEGWPGAIDAYPKLRAISTGVASRPRVRDWLITRQQREKDLGNYIDWLL